jgi:hypothetical protein
MPTVASQTQDIIAAIARRADTLERLGCDETIDRAGGRATCPTPTFCAEIGCSRVRTQRDRND